MFRKYSEFCKLEWNIERNRLCKGNIKRVEKASIKWKNIFVTHVTNKGLIFRITTIEF